MYFEKKLLLFSTEAVPKTVFCSRKLTAEDAEAFKDAINNRYWYQMYLDDLPIFGVVGELRNNGEKHVWLHRKIEIQYNGNQIVGVNILTSDSALVETGAELKFSYEVSRSISYLLGFLMYLVPPCLVVVLFSRALKTKKTYLRTKCKAPEINLNGSV